MAEQREINIISVNLVKEELVAASDSAAGHLDLYSASGADSQALASCIADVRQVCGVLQMVQLQAAELLAREMLSVLQDLEADREKPESDLLEAVSTGLYVITRYLEFVQTRGVARSELLIPYINQLRALRSQPPIPESQFFRCRLDGVIPGAGTASVMSEDLRHFARRFRHMYQVGLLAVMRGKPKKPAYTMMARALQRIASVAGSRPNGKLWYVAAAALASLAEQDAPLSRSRVMVLSMLDRRLREIHKRGGDVLDEQPSPVLLRETLYWLALAGDCRHSAVLQAFGADNLGFSAAELERDRMALGGPGATAMTAVASALDEELSGIRRLLDDADGVGLSALDEDEGLNTTLLRIANILELLNFRKAGEGLRKAVQGIRATAKIGGSDAEAALQFLTGQVLTVDSTIRALRQSTGIDVDESGSADIAIGRTQLAEAEVAVLSEAEAGLALIKRALGAYAESNFDYGHIRNVSTTLHSVRGGLLVLNLSKAAAVVSRLTDFVDTVMEQRESAPTIGQSLEIFADAIISLEYYVGEVKMNRKADTQSLDLAVDSLGALGYPVEAA